MIKDISHADVGKDDIDNVDVTYDDYYDVRYLSCHFTEAY